MFSHWRLAIQRRTVVAAAIALTLCLAGCARVPGVYVYEDASASQQNSGAFDAPAYVDGIWASKVLPTVQEKAVDAPTLLAAIKADPAAAGKQYGRQSGAGSPFAYLVKGTGTVTAIDAAAPAGPLTVQIGTPAAPQEITIATGPVLAGTALRDAVGFIDFSQFTNQLDYADVATQLNTKVKTEVVGKVDKNALVGKNITFAGAFTALSPTAITVIPTLIQAAP